MDPKVLFTSYLILLIATFTRCFLSVILCAFVHDAAFQLHPAEYLFVLGRVVSFICKDRSSPGSLCLLQRGFEMFDVALIGRGSLFGENESVLIRNRMTLIAEM